ncbi:hypothetical protein E2C01_092199 [Portunus trituberculatus]|uniref:Uncharacterized protein n=1 Tax=Portunus trituberculatus TaxID=210409 RepID=A0A5B7JV60_PORTR|nr:hypothetical protein [Portunus trituberculatus]
MVRQGLMYARPECSLANVREEPCRRIPGRRAVSEATAAAGGGREAEEGKAEEKKEVVVVVVVVEAEKIRGEREEKI